MHFPDAEGAFTMQFDGIMIHFEFNYDTFWPRFRCVLGIYDAIFQAVLGSDNADGIIRGGVR
jgi:hypothetical protein